MNQNEENLLNFIDQLEQNAMFSRKVEYKIVETSNNDKENRYFLHNLNAEIENGCVTFTDKKDILFRGKNLLQAFMISSIINAVETDGATVIKLGCGTINIQKQQ